MDCGPEVAEFSELVLLVADNDSVCEETWKGLPESNPFCYILDGGPDSRRRWWHDLLMGAGVWPVCEQAPPFRP